MENFLLKIGVSVQWADEIALFLILAGVSVAFGFFMGRFRLVNVLISIYIAIALLSVLPKEFLKFNQHADVFLFLIFVIGLTLADSALFDIHISGSGAYFFWRLFVMSFLEIGLIFSILTTLLPRKEVLEYISADAYNYFASSYAQFLWMVIPLLFVFFINKKLR